MANLFHFPTPNIHFPHNKLPSLYIPHHYFLIYRSKSVICASTKKPRASRKVKSNVDLCNDIREFLSSVGLPEDYVPTTKELSHHGRQDLANIVRRRGYKLLRELLSTSEQPTYDVCSGVGLVEKCEDESLGQDGNVEDMAHGVTLPSEASAVDDHRNDDRMLNSNEQTFGDPEPSGCSSLEEKVANFNNDKMLNSDEQTSGDQEPSDCSSLEEKVANFNDDRVLNSGEQTSGDPEPSGFSSLEEKVANFIQNGELDSIEDGGSEIFYERGSEQVEGSAEIQNVVETESSTPKEHNDLVLCNSHGAETFNGNLMPPSTQHVEDPSGHSFGSRNDNLSTEDLTMTEGRNSANVEPQKVENQAEINRLKFMLHQKELELTHLKQQIEEEKRVLSDLQTKAEREISEAQKLISEKEAELNAAEESLSELKEVEIEYWADGESVEVAGSFNGWHQKVQMDLHASSSIIDPIGEDIPASSNVIDPTGIRKPRLWKTVLWLYPGKYEIKFIVDGHWTTDPQRESVTRGAIQNNVLRVER